MSQVRQHAAAAAALEDFEALKALHWDGKRQQFLDWGDHSEDVSLQAHRSAFFPRLARPALANGAALRGIVVHQYQAVCSVIFLPGFAGHLVLVGLQWLLS